MIDSTICHEEWIKDAGGHNGEGYAEFIYQWYKDGQHWVKAGVKFDGCVSLTIAFNSPFPKDDKDYDNIHICGIDDLIKQLTLLKEVAKKHFGNDWTS